MNGWDIYWTLGKTERKVVVDLAGMMPLAVPTIAMLYVENGMSLISTVNAISKLIMKGE